MRSPNVMPIDKRTHEVLAQRIREREAAGFRYELVTPAAHQATSPDTAVERILRRGLGK